MFCFFVVGIFYVKTTLSVIVPVDICSNTLLDFVYLVVISASNLDSLVKSVHGIGDSYYIALSDISNSSNRIATYCAVYV